MGQNAASDASTPLPEGLWLVIPAFNEQHRITAVLDGVVKVVPRVIVVDDGSTDATGEQVLRRPVWLVVHPVNLGQGAAIQTGISFALQQGATHVVTFDADGQHRPEDIGAVVAALRANGADFALGSRFLGRADDIPWTRALLLRLASVFTRLISGVRVSDTQNGLRAMTRHGAARLRITFNGMEHSSEIIDQIARTGLRYVEVPVHIRYTKETLGKGQRTSAAIGLGLRLLLNKVTR